MGLSKVAFCYLLGKDWLLFDGLFEGQLAQANFLEVGALKLFQVFVRKMKLTHFWINAHKFDF